VVAILPAGWRGWKGGVGAFACGIWRSMRLTNFLMLRMQVGSHFFGLCRLDALKLSYRQNGRCWLSTRETLAKLNNSPTISRQGRRLYMGRAK